MKKLFWVLFVALFCEVYAYAEPVTATPVYPTGLRMPLGWQKKVKFHKWDKRSDVTLPTELDYSDIASAIKNQLSCGSCWAFASTEVMEYIIFLKTGKHVVLSPQELVSCDRGNSGCRGGWVSDYQVTPGQTYESEFKYVGRDIECKSNLPHDYHLAKWTFLGSQTKGPTIDEIKQTLVQVGPVWVGICGSAGGFQSYRSGIYRGPTSCQLNHAVVLEGYVEKGGKNSDGSINQGPAYWRLRNSWGEGWGEKGRMRIQFGSNAVGSVAAFAELP